METKNVDQPTAAPTNKTLVFLGASLLTGIALKLLEHFGLMEWIAVGGTMVSEELVRELIFVVFSGLIGMGLAYFQKDAPNQPELVAALKQEIIVTPGAVMPAIAREPEGD